MFAIALHARQTICLYDVKNFDKEPFATFTINDKELEKISYPPVMPMWTSIQFNNTGKLLLVLTAGDVHYVLDGYEGTMVARLVGHYGMSKAGFDAVSCGQEASWTPDGRFIVGGEWHVLSGLDTHCRFCGWQDLHVGYSERQGPCDKQSQANAGA